MSFREDDSTYINENGDTVFTSTYLRSKGRCCKASCLHCPFGHTLNTIGVKILDINTETEGRIKELINELVSHSNLTSSLLDEAFGAKKSYPSRDAKLLMMKDYDCGIVYIQNNKVKSVHLKKHFSDQRITDFYLQSLID